MQGEAEIRTQLPLCKTSNTIKGKHMMVPT